MVEQFIKSASPFCENMVMKSNTKNLIPMNSQMELL